MRKSCLYTQKPHSMSSFFALLCDLNFKNTTFILYEKMKKKILCVHMYKSSHDDDIIKYLGQGHVAVYRRQRLSSLT